MPGERSVRIAVAIAMAVALPAVLVAVPGAASAADCTKTSVGFTPLSDMAPGERYQGFAGGLYGDGVRLPPPAHRAEAITRGSAVTPLDTAGRPDAGGRIVLLSIGMSNATQEFSAFAQVAGASPAVSDRVLLVDGAQGGQTAAIIRDPAARFWEVVDERLAAAGSSPEQVQVAWIKEANARPTEAFPADARALQADLAALVAVAHDRYPNLRLAYLSSRTYGGYASTALNPEPYAYQSGFAVKWLVESQTAGEPSLNPYPARGVVEAPLLLWGPYLWADGLTPRADGLTWACSDFAEDGTHPSATGGRRKVAQLLMRFFLSDPTTRPWFAADPNATPGPTATGGATPTDGPTATNGPPPTMGPRPSRTAGPRPSRTMGPRPTGTMGPRPTGTMDMRPTATGESVATSTEAAWRETTAYLPLTIRR